MAHSNRLVEPRCVLKEADSRGERVLVRRGLSLISLNGFSRRPVGLLSGLFTPDPPRREIIGKLPVINRLMAT